MAAAGFAGHGGRDSPQDFLSTRGLERSALCGGKQMHSISAFQDDQLATSGP